MNFHKGEPRNHLTLGGTSCWTKTGKDPAHRWVAHRFARPVLSWLGVSWRGSWFFGFIRTGEMVTETRKENPPTMRTRGA